MCYRLFVIFMFVLWSVYLIQTVFIRSSHRKEMDEIIACGDGPPERIDRLIDMLRHKRHLGKQDKIRLDSLISIRNTQIKGVKHVESKVRKDK
jgi:hypothetical protein